MLKTEVKPFEELNWEELRHRATVLGIPAWSLAEQLASHEKDGQLVFKVYLDNTKT